AMRIRGDGKPSPYCRATRLLAGDAGEGARDDACSFLHRDDLVDGNVGELIHGSTRPGDFQPFDALALSQAEVEARIVGGHVTHAAFPLLVLSESLGNQL